MLISNKNPNIILIMSDTVRPDLLGCMGGLDGVTPNLDRLAGEGVLFDNAHTCSPVCGPARCSLLTGTYPQVHQAFENGFERLDNLPVFTDALKKQGYHNIMVGKTHFGKIPESFDVVYPAPRPPGLGIFHTDEEFTGNEENPEELGCDADWTNRFIQEIEKAKDANNPFFAFCSLNSPHDPLNPPGRFRTMFKDAELPPINYTPGEEDRQPELLRKLLGIKDDEKLQAYPGRESHPFNAAQGAIYDESLLDEINDFRRLYYGYMAYNDALIGKILDYIDTNGLKENTLIIFTSDHGQSYFDHGFNDKHNFYDESFRVPLIMRLPGKIPAGVKRGFATTTDVTATILAAGGTSCDTICGFDLITPIIKGEPNPRNCAVGVLCGYIALATERYKIEYYLHDTTGRLFDRIIDPAEQMDLYYSESHKEVRDKMLTILLNWYANTFNLNYLRTHSSKGGPVATRSKRYMDSIDGLASERILEKQLVKAYAAVSGGCRYATPGVG